DHNRERPAREWVDSHAICSDRSASPRGRAPGFGGGSGSGVEIGCRKRVLRSTSESVLGSETCGVERAGCPTSARSDAVGTGCLMFTTEGVQRASGLTPTPSVPTARLRLEVGHPGLGRFGIGCRDRDRGRDRGRDRDPVSGMVCRDWDRDRVWRSTSGSVVVDRCRNRMLESDVGIGCRDRMSGSDVGIGIGE
ncbi:MAG: hypothetical protein RLZZ238_2646, partial [Planctomycetota bacterium]